MKSRSAAIFAAAIILLTGAAAHTDTPLIKDGLQFVGGAAHINGKLIGKVWALDHETGVRKTIVEIKADAGPQWDRVTRAKTIAARLQSEYDKNPTFYTKLFRDLSPSGDIVITTNRQGQWIMTADASSARLNNQAPDDYANTIKNNIQKVLSDPSVR